MKLSAKSRYASRILLDLALHNEGVPHRVNDISERTGITVPFIEQIMMIRFRHSRPVEVASFQRFLDITFKLFTVTHEEPMLNSMCRGAIN